MRGPRPTGREEKPWLRSSKKANHKNGKGILKFHQRLEQQESFSARGPGIRSLLCFPSSVLTQSTTTLAGFSTSLFRIFLGSGCADCCLLRVLG